ncbi:MAG: DUF1211 domain-containing protein [Planctomycetes bacterium]|nr:DUF1211 domain-containing protein [Planctomycetota bacterium]
MTERTLSDPELGPPPGEPRFRWRGGDGSRLEALGDGVFALSLTLLLLSSEVPRRTGDLWRVLQEAVPFAITFAILGMIWFAHFLFFRRYGLRDRLCVFLNFALLFLVLVYAYPLKFVFSLVARGLFGMTRVDVATDDRSFPLMEFYGIGFGLIYAVLAAMYAHAWRLRDQLQLDAYERNVTRQWLWQHLAMVVIAGCSVLAAVVLPARLTPWSGFVYFAIGPTMGLFAVVWERRRAALRDGQVA